MSPSIDPAADSMARNLGEVVDHFLTVPFCLSGGPSAFAERPIIKKLYGAARELTGDLPLCYAAARALMERVPMGGTVIIGTGFIVPPYCRLEGDGPMGVPFLARALALAREAHTIVVTEPANAAAIEVMLRGVGGLQFASVDEALEVPHKIAIAPFPVVGESESRDHAAMLLDKIKPDAMMTIEKVSRNFEGRYYNGMAVEVTDVAAKLDLMIDEARRRGVLTIGFGDGGNEMGMGNILSVIEEVVPNGKTVASHTMADILVVAGSASWGSYGVEALLAALSGKHHALHDVHMERRLTDACANAGIVDPLTGLADGWLDGVPPQVCYSIVEVLNYIFDVRTRPWALEKYRSWGGRKDEANNYIQRHATRLASCPS